MKVRIAVIPLLLLYPLYAAVMFAAQAKMLFPAASHERHPLRANLPANAQLVEIPASFGKIRAVYLRVETATRRAPAILYLHGNYECIEDSFSLMQPLVASGLPVLQLEFPGFCGADGTPSYASINEVATRAFDWLSIQPEVDGQRIIVVGYSMGGGAAAELTQLRPAAALVLLSTYTSLADVAHRYALPGFLVRFPYDNVARVRDFSGPILIEHGRHDEVIPFAMGEQLARTKPDIDFVPLDCGHADCHFDQAIFAQRLPAWLIAHRLLDANST